MSLILGKALPVSLADSCSVVIPARNEADRLPDLLHPLLSFFPDRTIVVDNASSDRTLELAKSLGALTACEPRVGKGYAVMKGMESVQTEWTFLCDADIHGLSAARVDELLDATHKRGSLGRLCLARQPDLAPVTSLLAQPLLFGLGLPRFEEPLGGLALVKTSFLRAVHVPGGWGFDVALTLRAWASGEPIIEVAAPEIGHRKKPLGEYVPMANEVASSILKSLGLVSWDHQDCVCGAGTLRGVCSKERESFRSALP